MIFEKILGLCDQRGVSLSRLEKDCNLGNATVRGWDKSSPKVENLQKVADYFGKTVDYFLKEEKTKTK